MTIFLETNSCCLVLANCFNFFVSNRSLQSMEDNIAALDMELLVAGNGQEKEARLKDKKSKMVSRRMVVESIVPITRKLKKSSDIQKIYAALHNIHVLEDKSRSMSLTLADLKKIEPKFDLEQQLIQFQQMSRYCATPGSLFLTMTCISYELRHWDVYVYI